MPDCAESAASPTVFSATVLPPVFGPLITITVSAPPSASDSGIAVRPCGRSVASSTGLRAASSRSEFPCGEFRHHAIEFPRESRARENRIEMRDRSRPPPQAAPRSARSRSVSSARMRAISAASSSAQLHQPVIEIDRFERLDENGLPRGARAVHHAGHRAPVRRAHRNHEAVVAQRDVVLARMARRARAKYFRANAGSFSRACTIPARMRRSCGEASSLISPFGSTARRIAVERCRKSASAAARSAQQRVFRGVLLL